MFRIVSYTADYCVKPLGLYVQDRVSHTADYCVKPLGLYVQDRVIYSRLLCEAIRAVCSGSCHIQPSIV